MAGTKSGFPGPYVNDTGAEGSDPIMEYVPFDTMGIGARKSGLPSTVSTGPKMIDHVGSTTGKAKS